MALVFGSDVARRELERERQRQKYAYITDIYRALDAIVERDDVGEFVWKWAFDTRAALEVVFEEEGVEI